LLPQGSIVLGADLLDQLDGAAPCLGFEELGLLLLVLCQLEHAKAFGPRSRIEPGDDDGPVLVLDQNYGCGTQFDPDMRLGSTWTRALDQLAANGWLDVTKNGHEIRVRRGRRAKEVTR
jgi:hypothetical protein